MEIKNVKKMIYDSATKSMPAIAFFGRLTFGLAFIITAIQDYADHYGDGGPLEITLGPAVNAITKYGSKVLTFYTGMQVIAFDVKIIEFTLISAKATGALWFIFGSSVPAYFMLATQMLSTVIPLPTNMHDFTQNLTLIGALLYYIGLKHTIDDLAEYNRIQNIEDKFKEEASTSKSKSKSKAEAR